MSRNIPNSINCGALLLRLQCVTEDQAIEQARKDFIRELGHIYVDVPVVSDAAGKSQYSRFRLKEFLEAGQPATGGK